MDCIAILGRDDKEQIEARHTRFPEWDTQVLGCLTNTRDTIEMIHQRQREADTDRAEIEEFLQQLKKSRGTCCELDTKTLCEDWKRFFGKELSTAQMGTILKNAAAKGRLSGLKRKTKKNGSPWIWSPYDVESGESEEMMPSPSPSPGGQNGGSIFAPSPDNVQNVQGDDF